MIEFPVEQITPIISSDQIAELESITFKVKKSSKNSENAYYTKNLYTANDVDFINYLVKRTKVKRVTLLEDLGVNETGFNNTNRLTIRLLCLKRFGKGLRRKK